MLHGRKKELAEIDRLLADARAGLSSALIMRAEPGWGKTALLGHAEQAADGFLIMRGVGVETETELPFAALQMLLRPALDRLGELPGPQAAALRGAFGLAPATGADRFLIGLATLTLLAELAEDRPVLCLIDDAQWLDGPSSEALLFAARRLHAEGIVMLFAAHEDFTAPTLPTMRLGGLDRAAATAMLAERAPDLPSHVRDRILAESEGNPLALTELPGADIGALPIVPLPLPHRLRETYRRRIDELPARARTFLLVAAAEERSDLTAVLRALRILGVAEDALEQAERAGIVAVRERSVVFGYPLMRAAAYQAGSFAERAAVHRALAEVFTDDPDRRAWHLAAAATGPDEEVAAGLESAAERAGQRTGYAAAATALELAARLTPARERRAGRLLRAAETAFGAGQPTRATALADQAAELIEDPAQLARLAVLRAGIEYEHGSLRAVHEILTAAAQTVPDPVTAAALLLDAARAAWAVGDPGRLELVHGRLRALPLPPEDATVASVGAMIELVAGDPVIGLSGLRGHLARMPGRTGGKGPAPATTLALLSGDFETVREAMLTLVAECRAQGMIGWLPPALGALAEAEIHLGRFRDAAVSAEEALRIAEDIGRSHRTAHLYGVLAFVAAIGGEAERCRDLAERNLRHFALDYNASGAAWGEWALAVLDLGSGHPETALDRLEAAADGPIGHQNHADHFAPDQIEAAIRLGAPERATVPLLRFERWAAAVDAPWAQAVLHRCRALLADDPEPCFMRAVHLHATGGRPFDSARTRLLYGEWLRRLRRKSEARTHLRAALELFERVGATPWADHARAELRAAGEAVAQVGPDAAALLSPQELQVVRLAAAGATNREIAAQLFLSPKTVGHHLYRAFPKLRVSTRVELARLAL
ncbi:LuxR C-terminal-related transcriptional regulator [Streptosporangium sp. CA-135522]|uniref:helix-turn-helix transcriptional regulator n=1 Tax=Streptosporangium sp. CA-135522 TaxID=3240072 RepID=UPI003D8AC859